MKIFLFDMKILIPILLLFLGLAACQSKTSDKGNTSADSTKTAPAAEQPLKLSWEVKVLSTGEDAAPSSALLLVANGKKIGLDTSIFYGESIELDAEQRKTLKVPQEAIFTGSIGGMDEHNYYYILRKGEDLDVWFSVNGLDESEDGEPMAVSINWKKIKTLKLSDFK
jgi:hypothetical protein